MVICPASPIVPRPEPKEEFCIFPMKTLTGPKMALEIMEGNRSNGFLKTFGSKNRGVPAPIETSPEKPFY